MAEALLFKDQAAAEYDRAFAHVTAHFMPFLRRAVHVAPGMHVLDIATGTGLSAEAALAAVGPTGHVTAADVSPAMAEKARERLGETPNASVSVEDGQALSFADCSFDVVLCNLGLMFFPDPVRGLSEFRRVLRPGGRVAVSVNTVVERSYNHQINVIIARHLPSLSEAVTRTFALGDASRLLSLFAEAGLADIETQTDEFRVSTALGRLWPFVRSPTNGSIGWLSASPLPGLTTQIPVIRLTARIGRKRNGSSGVSGAENLPFVAP
jgi:ubiquinone/menaquinone biosynthesis C-methylase UbiE